MRNVFTLQRSLLLVLISTLTFSGAARADEADLTDLDLATLMNMDVTVTSASRRAQSVDHAPAAVFVITRDDIRRSGAATLPEALRLAPGVQVGRVNTRSWAVSARGFTHRFANKLLVMVDGRSIYTSAFSGVMWEEQPVFLDDIERIEIVRGPGGALWGVNAVNGVINIITRSAAQTHGVQVSASGGSAPETSASVRAGDDGDWGDYRVYAQRAETDRLRAAESNWLSTMAGFRIDAGLADGALTVQGDVHESDFGTPDGPPEVGLTRRVDTGNALVHWTRASALGAFDLRAFHSWTDRSPPLEWSEMAHGLEAQFAANRIGRHVLTGGAGLRRTADEQDATSSRMTITGSTQTEWSVYGQDEMHFFSDRVHATLGAKIESSEFAGTELQPTLRTLWNATQTHTLWTGFSRVSRAPSRFELHSGLQLSLPPGALPAPLPIEVSVMGEKDLKPETMEALEAGWRWRPDPAISVDLALYRNEYEHLILLQSLPYSIVMTPTPHIEAPIVYANAGRAYTEGAELSTEWAARDWLRLQAFATWHDLYGVQLDEGVARPGGQDVGRMLSLRARIDLPHHAQLDLAWRRVGSSFDRRVPEYDNVNVRLAWQPLPGLEASLAIENALDERRVESDDFLNQSLGVEIGRSYLARVIWRPR
jgi:iron complex outermembrane recepter protein